MLPPIFILMVSNCVTYLIWNYFMMDGALNDLPIFLCLIGIVILQLAVCPLAIIWFYKTYLLISKNSVKNAFDALAFLKEKKIFRNTVAINFLPALLNILILVFSNGNMIYHTKNVPLLTACFICKVIVTYKLFMCNYYFALSGSGARKSLSVSFKLMKGKIKAVALFYFSFVGWIAVSILMYFIFKGISLGEEFSLSLLFYPKLFNPILKSASAFLYGVGFYLYPYLLIAKSEYCNKLLGDTVF